MLCLPDIRAAGLMLIIPTLSQAKLCSGCDACVTFRCVCPNGDRQKATVGMMTAAAAVPKLAPPSCWAKILHGLPLGVWNSARPLCVVPVVSQRKRFLMSRKAGGVCGACRDHFCLLLSSRASNLAFCALFFSPLVGLARFFRSDGREASFLSVGADDLCVALKTSSLTPKISVLPGDKNESSLENGTLLSLPSAPRGPSCGRVHPR